MNFRFFYTPFRGGKNAAYRGLKYRFFRYVFDMFPRIRPLLSPPPNALSDPFTRSAVLYCGFGPGSPPLLDLPYFYLGLIQAPPPPPGGRGLGEGGALGSFGGGG